MVVDEKGYNLIKQFEGLRLTAYRCPAGKWTIGYGHTKGVKKVCTYQKLLRPIFNSRCSTRRTDHQQLRWHLSLDANEFDALASFAFNCGTGNLKKLLKYGQRTKSQIANAICYTTKQVVEY